MDNGKPTCPACHGTGKIKIVKVAGEYLVPRQFEGQYMECSCVRPYKAKLARRLKNDERFAASINGKRAREILGIPTIPQDSKTVS